MGNQARRRVAVVTISDGVSSGTREDASGRAVAALLEGHGFEVAVREVIPDERPDIEGLLRSLSQARVPLVVTTGGTGFGPRDVTPESTRAVIDREAPGLAEAMRAAGRAATPMADLSREIVGSRGSTLIVNLPGSEKGATESLAAILDVLPHALDLLAGDTVHGPADHGPAAAHHAEHGHHDHGHGDAEEPREETTIATPHAHDVDAEAIERRAAREPVVVGTAIRTEGDPPCAVGQKILLGPDGALAGTLGCAEFDQAAVSDAPTVLSGRLPVTRTYAHDLGTVEVFLEPFVPLPRLVVFSATPVALHLLRWAGEVGFDPVLVETRPERVTREHRAAAPVVGSLDEVTVDEETEAIHTDHDAPGVAETVAALLRSPARFVGIMGSRRHVGPYLEELRSMGFSDQDLGRLRSPAGLDLGGRTAAEIALSILAGIVAARHEKGGGWLDRPSGSPQAPG
jgi:molybdenum cofactor synthesis domain-containing protein